MAKTYNYEDGKLGMTAGFAPAGAGGFFLIGANDVYVATIDETTKQNLSEALAEKANTETVNAALASKLNIDDIEPIPEADILALFS